MHPIGVVHSHHRERHGTPRQACVSDESAQRRAMPARVELFPNRIPVEAVKDLEGFERVWILSFFHLNQGYRPLVIPPRGPRVRRGVLSTRAPHRPNGIGLSCCRLLDVDGASLVLESVDLLDGTPVLDVKPYVPFADAFPEATAGWVDGVDDARR